jgi:hypothetical protein
MTTLIEKPVHSDVAFDVDAMLMYGWVSDAERRITHVSNSLRRWIHDHTRTVPQANEKLSAIDSGHVVTVCEFLAALLDPNTERDTPAAIERYMKELNTRLTGRDNFAPRSDERYGEYAVRIQFRMAEAAAAAASRRALRARLSDASRFRAERRSRRHRRGRHPRAA